MTDKQFNQILQAIGGHKEGVRDIAEALVGSPLVDPSLSVAGGLRAVASAIDDLAAAIRETSRR